MDLGGGWAETEVRGIRVLKDLHIGHFDKNGYKQCYDTHQITASREGPVDDNVSAWLALVRKIFS